MSYCLVPGCYRPQNPATNRMCQSCGAKLLLRERYRALQPIGQGGFGRTFLAIDEDLPSQPHCVIKQLHLPAASDRATAKAIQLFQQEAVRLDDLGKHPQIPTLLAHFEQDRLLYLVQEFVDGQTIAQELAQHGTFEEIEIWALLRDLLPILKFIHDQHVIHRDLKPANLMRQQDKTLMLIDFGVAKLVTEAKLGDTGTVIGSPEYMAPEQTRGKAVPASDLYSVGVVAVQLLTQVAPFNLFDVASNRWVWRDFLPPGKRISKRLGEILDRLLQTALNDRFQSADEVLQALERPGRTLAPAPTTPLVTSPPESLTGLPALQIQSLKQLLASKKWEQADTFTWDLLRQLLNKPERSYIFSGELSLLPCAELQQIDLLWLQSSQRRFGFSVQGRIYQGVGQDYGAFCDRVGWQPDNRGDRPNLWRFQSNAPAGHLPSRLYIGGQQWWRHLAAMTTKLTDCHQI